MKKPHLAQAIALFFLLLMVGSAGIENWSPEKPMEKPDRISKQTIDDLLRANTKGVVNHVILNHRVLEEETREVAFHESAEEVKTEIQKTAPTPIRGIYMTAYTLKTKNFQTLVDQLLKSGGNAIVMDIEEGGGKLAFLPKNPTLQAINPGNDDIDYPTLLKKLREQGIYTIARQVIFNDPYTAARKPEWRIKNRWGGLFDNRWLDPSHPETQNYNLMILQEVAALGFDEVQFDYIRFPTTNHNNVNYYFEEEKYTHSDVINHFLENAVEIAHEEGVKLGVDVFGATVWGDIDWKLLGQSIPELGKIVDVIYPMVYPSHYSPGYYGHGDTYNAPYAIVHNSVKRFEERSEFAEIRPWLQGFPLRVNYFGDWYVKEQVKATYDAGSKGFIIWSPGNVYTHSWSSLDPSALPTEAPDEPF